MTNLQLFEWAQQDWQKGNDKVPDVFFFDIECFHLYYDDDKTTLSQYVYEKDGNNNYDYINCEPKLKSLYENVTYGYVIDHLRNIYAWVIDTDDDKKNGASIFSEQSTYFGHLTFGVYADFIQNRGFLECDSLKSVKESLSNESQGMSKLDMQILQEAICKSTTYKSEFTELYSSGKSRADKAAVYAAGEFRIDSGEKKIVLKLNINKTDLTQSGHYLPFKDEDNRENKMIKQLLKLIEESPNPKENSPFKQALEAYKIAVEGNMNKSQSLKSFLDDMLSE